jgi:hypothetical protein
MMPGPQERGPGVGGQGSARVPTLQEIFERQGFVVIRSWPGHWIGKVLDSVKHVERIECRVVIVAVATREEWRAQQLLIEGPQNPEALDGHELWKVVAE